MKKRLFSYLLTSGLAVMVTPSHAMLISDSAEINNAYTVTFDGLSFYGVASDVAISAGQITLGFNTTGGAGSLGEAPLGAWGLDSNGLWSLGKTFAGVDGSFDNNAQPASMIFDFGTAKVAEVGAFLNFSPDFTYDASPFGTLPLPLYIAALDENNNVIEYQELPIWTPGAINDGAFYGFSHNTADIVKFVVSGPYAVADNLMFSTPVDEPTAFALASTAFALLAFSLVRRRDAINQ